MQGILSSSVSGVWERGLNEFSSVDSNRNIFLLDLAPLSDLLSLKYSSRNNHRVIVSFTCLILSWPSRIADLTSTIIITAIFDQTRRHGASLA